MAATAAKSLQLCPTLCDPTDSSPEGSPVPGILQARTLEWGAIAFSETPGVTGKFGLGSTERSRAKANRVLPRECNGHSKHPLPRTQDSTHGHHQVVNTKIRLIIFFAAKHRKVLYSQQK